MALTEERITVTTLTVTELTEIKLKIDTNQ